ncbi:MAG TPA: glycosyltransferase [Streptosporangiaceae bacterium]|nr:glycosyltransferase [Streptosporangiaceae bacterium]
MLIALAASLLAVAAWVYLVAGHGGFWRTDQRLPPAGAANQAAWPAVVAVIPARDEAPVLPETLPTLLTQDYQGQLTVVLVDDESTDGTAEVAAKLSDDAQSGTPANGQRLKVISGEPPPPGWAGKVWAMDQGLRAAGAADYVLFTDADIAYAPGTVSALIRAAEADNRVLVSQMALLRTDTFAERLLIPAFVYFFAQLYPFRWVNRRGGRTAAAAGGCMLVRRAPLEAAGGLGQIRGARIDDVALGRLLKRAPAAGDCWLGFTTDVISRRQYNGLGEIWDMVARSAYTQLRYSPAALAGTVLGMAFLYLLPVGAALAGPALMIGGQAATGVPGWLAAWLAAAGLAGWAIMAVSYLPMLRLTRLSPLRAVSLPLIGVLYTAMTVSSARRHHAGQGGEWKGRTIQQDQLASRQ